MKKYNDIQKILWITHSLRTNPEKELLINKTLPHVIYYGKVFEFINQLFGKPSISKEFSVEKGLLAELEAVNVELIMNRFIEYKFVQLSPNQEDYELNFPSKRAEVYKRIFEDEAFGSLNLQEKNMLKILDFFPNTPISKEKITDGFPPENASLIDHLLSVMAEISLITSLDIENQECFMCSLTTYGEHETFVNYCNRHSSDDIGKVGELLEFCENRKGYPIGMLPEHLKPVAEQCIEFGILHGVNYEFGNQQGAFYCTLIFPTKKEFDMITHSVNDFDKIHAILGMLTYGVYFNPHKINRPRAYIRAMIESGSVRGTTIGLEDKLRQFNPAIFAGVLEFKPGISTYETRYGNLRGFTGYAPEIIGSEENRIALSKGLDFFETNTSLTPDANSAKVSLFENNNLYSDTAGLSAYKIRKKSKREKYIENLFYEIRGGGR